jgi:hypothetical protein
VRGGHVLENRPGKVLFFSICQKLTHRVFVVLFQLFVFFSFFAWPVFNRFMGAVVSAVFFCFFLLEVDRVVCPTCQKSFFFLENQ